MSQLIRKAVFPVAGLGTRFLPATKANPKEMLPIVDKPLIQYAVEEAMAAGITEMIFVTNSSKRAIEDHFDSHFELEYTLKQKEKFDLWKLVKDIVPSGIRCVYVRQSQALGLGHAVLCAKEIVGNEPFAVLLADDLIQSNSPCLVQMINLFQEHPHSMVAVQKIQAQESKKYGVIDVNPDWELFGAVKGIVEKPPADLAPSNLGVVGRYLLTPEVFTMLEKTPKGSGKEIQLTDAISLLMADQTVCALEFEGTRFDCGSKLGYLQATVSFGLSHPEVKEPFKDYLQNLAHKAELMMA